MGGCLTLLEHDELTIMYGKLLDGLTPTNVKLTPFGPVLDDSVVYFYGCIRFYDINETYMPDRVTRQFGRAHRIPGPEPSVPHYLQWYEEHSHVRVSNPAHEAAPGDDNDLVDPPATVQSRDTHDWHEVQSIVLSRMSKHDPDLLAEGYRRLHDLLVRRGL
ncbi:hypothetical protein LIER_41721 [Lithospermum erythrorhizon]|uniref:Uncharacterized protein n=1 Tax=Lithospermum erythrorhizon TaxID=34254 RepID=A0AAV3RDG5_LITER